MHRSNAERCVLKHDLVPLPPHTDTYRRPPMSLCVRWFVSISAWVCINMSRMWTCWIACEPCIVHRPLMCVIGQMPHWETEWKRAIERMKEWIKKRWGREIYKERKGKKKRSNQMSCIVFRTVALMVCTSCWGACRAVVTAGYAGGL